MFMVWLTFRFAGNDPSAPGPGIWYLTGTGPLLVSYIYLILKIARHAVLQQLFWLLVALGVAAILFVTGNIMLAVFTASLSPDLYAERIGTLLLAMTALVCLILLLCFLVSIWTALLKNRFAEPGSSDRQIAQGKILRTLDSADSQLEAGEHLTLDFGLRLIEDHGYKADLRVQRDNPALPIEVEVSNDNSSWVACEIDKQIPTDYDVPYIGSPWRYVRITNTSDQPTTIGEVSDLD